MTNHYRAVAGRVTQKPNQQPVHGLLVKIKAVYGGAAHADADCTFPLGCDLTDQDGRYWVPIDAESISQECICKGRLEFHIDLCDRDGRQIHSERRKGEDCPRDTTFRFDVQVEASALECHLARPVSWTPPAEPLLPDSIADDIEEALELLTGGAAAHRPTQLQGLLCAEPTIATFDNVLSDAWKTLQGDLEAAGRYRGVLNAICAGGADKCCCKHGNPHGDAIDDILRERCEVDPCKPVKVEPLSPCCTDEPPCPDQPVLVSDDKVAILVMAALHIGCRHPATTRAYLVAILDQICRLQFLTELHRAALGTVCEKPGAKDHFRDLLELLACKCAPSDRTLTRKCDQMACCWVCVRPELLHCIRDAYRNWCAIGCYTITHVEPQRACPGETVVICGCGFGRQPGRVSFVKKGSMSPGPLVSAETWSDDRITVVVPQGAGCGFMLVAPLDTIYVCDRFLDYRITGTAKEEFEGTSPEILKFVIKGHQHNDCLLPGEVLKIRWKTCATDRVVVRIIDLGTGNVIAQRNPAPETGRWDFDATNFNKTTRLSVEITASGKCEPPSVTRQITLIFQKPPDLSIDGVEVTQAIQYYNAAQHLTDPADRGPNNSLQLVASKSAWVRTYLRSGQDPSFDMGQLTNVSGTMTVERRVGGVWSVVANLAPVNGPITAQDSFASYDAERRDIDATLNFVVPANTMTGLLRFTIRVSSPDDCYGGSATSVQQVDVDLDQELRIAAVSVGYNGPPIGGGANVTFAAPTQAQIATEAGYSLLVYPVRSVPNIRIIDTQTATQPLNDNSIPAGGCDANWTPILNLVANARTNDGNQAGWFYYGFVTANIPISHGNVGCASGGNGAGLLGGGVTLAHEIGHQAGLNHAPCGAVGTVTPGFPLYEPYDTGVTTTNAAGNTVWQDASIGEYGLDVSDGTIYNPNPIRPNNGKDLMGYCGNRWVSIFTHNFMVNNASMNPVSLATGVSGDGQAVGSGMGPDRANQIRPFITILGAVSVEREVAVTSVARVPTRELTMTGSRTDLVVELLAEEGKVASSAPVFTMPAHEGSGCGCAEGKPAAAKPPFAFIAALPDVTEGSAIRICRKDEVVWERKRPRARLEFERVRASVRKDGLYVSWSFDKKPASNPEIWLRWSEDGTVWNGLAVGLSGTSVTLDPALIPADRVILQVIAHDGFRSVTAQSEFVELPERPPTLAIVHPTDGQTCRPGVPLHLWAASSRLTEEPVWLVDGKEVGRGSDTWTPMPQPGEHTVELRAAGAESVKVVVTVEGGRS